MTDVLEFTIGILGRIISTLMATIVIRFIDKRTQK